MMFFSKHLPEEISSRLLDGMLDSRGQAKAERHLRACTSCARRFEGQAGVKSALKALPVLESNPLQELQAPLFIPVPRSAFPARGFAAGVAAGAALLAAVSYLNPPDLPMRVVSAPVPAADLRLQPGEAVRASTPGDVDLEIPRRLLLRLKPGTLITWQEINRTWGQLGGRPQIVLNVLRGEVLARTQDKFWGSRLVVRTPSASATVKGTVFSVKVEPEQDATVLKVLAGSVFFSPHAGTVGRNIHFGQSSRIEGERLPRPAEELSPAERKTLLETYRIGEDPAAELVIGAGPERTTELLHPALLYLSSSPHPGMHRFIRGRVAAINRAILEGDLSKASAEVGELESSLATVLGPELAVPLRLFVGACDVRLGVILRGRAHFRWVADRHPQHPLASLALSALGRTAEENLRNPELAQAAYRQVKTLYPSGPEADLAREFLRRY